MSHVNHVMSRVNHVNFNLSISTVFLNFLNLTYGVPTIVKMDTFSEEEKEEGFGVVAGDRCAYFVNLLIDAYRCIVYV